MAKRIKPNLPDDFAIFILTHGRPDRVLTYHTLIRGGYTGPVYIVIDDEDKRADEYRARFGDKVIMFDKRAQADAIDEGDNFGDRRSILYARNASFEIAQKLGVKRFMQLDDDYRTLCYRMDSRRRYLDSNMSTLVLSLDAFFAALLRYFDAIPALSLAIAQSGDILGGSEADFFGSLGRRRKAMNTFICSTDRPFGFVGRINEDVNTYTTLGNRGGLFLTFALAAIQQAQTQKQPGGMTGMYKDFGTYVKSFYTVMMLPSAVKVRMLHTANARIHHKINWSDAVPCIIREKHRKPGPRTT